MSEMEYENRNIIYNDIDVELLRARGKHEKHLNSPLEAWAVIWEELEEFRVSVKDGNMDVSELIQTAAMCIRAIEDLGLTRKIDKSTPCDKVEDEK